MQSDFFPLVSIIIPVYNGSDFLKEAIDSALAQTYKNIEIIVVNDGSSDNGTTENIALTYGNKIRYISKENGGVATALNLGIENMKGDYFSWLSHDDVYYTNKVEVQINCLRKLENKNTIIFSEVELIDKNSKHLIYNKLKEYQIKNGLSSVIYQGLNGCAMLIPRTCFNDYLFDENLLTTQDYDLWYKLAKRYDFKHTPEFLVKSRFHPNQGSRKISTHKNEINSTLLQTIDNLTNDEIKSIDNSPAHFYLKTAVFYKFLGYNITAKNLIKYYNNALNNNAIKKFKFYPLYLSYSLNPYSQYLGLAFLQLFSPGEWNGYIKIFFATMKKRKAVSV